MLADLILIAIILINALIGFRRGLIDMLGRLLIFLVSLVLTLLLVSPLAAWLAGRPALEPLARKFADSILEPLRDTAPDIAAVVASFKLPPILENMLQEQMAGHSGDFSETFPALSASIFRFALVAALFVLFFALITILIHIISRSLTRVSDKVPVLGTANRLAGLATGSAFGLLQVVILLLLAGLTAAYFPAIGDFIENSRIAEFFYSRNFLNRFI